MQKFNRIAIFVALLALLFASFSPASVSSAQDDWWATAAKPYAGVTLRGVSESTPPSNYVKDVLAKEFEKKTGIKVELETTSWDQQYDKAIKDMEAKTGIYDFVYVEQDIIYSYLANKYLTNLTQMLKDKPDLAAADFKFDNFTTFLNYFKDPNANNDVFGVPMEAFIKIYLYRKDLFGDTAVKDAFKAKYSRDLAPAKTHKEYQEIAEFFTEWGKTNKLDLWGTSVQATSGHPASFYEFFESVAPTFGVYNWGINMKNWKATSANGGTLDGDKAKAALTYWTGLLKFGPPESTSSTWDEVAATFAAGRVAQGLVYGENAAWIGTDPDRSKVVGKIGVALPPLEDGVLDAAKKGEGYIGYYDGGAFGLPASSKNKEAALLWLQFIGLDSVQADWAVKAPRITHKATFDDPKVQEQDKKIDGYYTLLKNEGYLFGGAPAFPFHAQIREVMAPFIYKAITGEIKPADALDQMAKAVDAELVKLGYGK